MGLMVHTHADAASDETEPGPSSPSTSTARCNDPYRSIKNSADGLNRKQTKLKAKRRVSYQSQFKIFYAYYHFNNIKTLSQQGVGLAWS